MEFQQEVDLKQEIVYDFPYENYEMDDSDNFDPNNIFVDPTKEVEENQMMNVKQPDVEVSSGPGHAVECIYEVNDWQMTMVGHFRSFVETNTLFKKKFDEVTGKLRVCAIFLLQLS